MDSTTFRRDYAKLTEPTEVTVLGRRIGIYYPEGTAPKSSTRLETSTIGVISTPVFDRPATPAPKRR